MIIELDKDAGWTCYVFPFGPFSSNSVVVDQTSAPSSLAPLSTRFKVNWQGVIIIEATVVWWVMALTHFILASKPSVANFKDKIVSHDVGGRTLVCRSMAVRINLSKML